MKRCRFATVIATASALALSGFAAAQTTSKEAAKPTAKPASSALAGAAAAAAGALAAPTKAPAAAVPAAPATGAAAPATAAAAAEPLTVEKSSNPELVGALVKQVGVTPAQAEGGTGAILGYAKSALKVEDYTKVAAAVPGIDGLLKSAPATEATGSSSTTGALVGAAAGALGGKAGLSSVTGSFSKLGLSGDTVTKYVPVILGYVQGKGGKGTSDILASVLK